LWGRCCRSVAGLHAISEIFHALLHDGLGLFSLNHLEVFQQVRLNLTFLNFRLIPQLLGVTQEVKFKLLVLSGHIDVSINLALVAIVNDVGIVTDIVEVAVEKDIQRTKARTHYAQKAE